MPTATAAPEERAALGPWTIAGALVLATVLRGVVQAMVPADPALAAPPFAGALIRPPLWDALGWVAGPLRPWLAPLCGVLLIPLVDGLLPASVGLRRGMVLLAAVLPAAVVASARHVPVALVALLLTAAALQLLRVLEGRGAAWWLGLFVSLALLSDWTAWAPLGAWWLWLRIFAEPQPGLLVRGAARALDAALVVGTLGLVFVLWRTPDLWTALGMDRFPLGLAALFAFFDTWGGQLWPRPSALGPALRSIVDVGAFVVVIAAARESALPARIVSVGLVGGFVVGLALHQWWPVLGEKHGAVGVGLWVAALAWVVHGWRSRALLMPTRVPAASAKAVLLFVAVTAACEVDDDRDGHSVEDGDCDDGHAGTHPLAIDFWNGRDDNCDGVVDVDPAYVVVEESEPNDAALGACFAPSGQDLGHLPGQDLLLTVYGQIGHITDEQYDESDRDCFVLSMPADAVDNRLEVELLWADEGSDLDFALWGLWEGEQAGFAQQNNLGPGPERALSSGTFDASALLWLWVAGYSGPPTDYTLRLISR